MKITVLTENNPGAFLLAEHGLSYLIEFEDKRILFDTGQSDVFIKNAEKMKISLANINMIVLSHGHFDHGNGLNYLPGGSLICHSGCFVRRYRKKDHSYIGLLNTKEELSGKFDLETTTDPLKITEKIYFLGEIPRLTDFESRKTSFVFGDGTPDYVMDDSALAFVLPEGLFIVTGCGHAGVVNTFEHARRITGISNLCGIIGGFHLKEIDIQTKETIRYLKENKVENIYPSHCTELPALSAFYEEFGIRQLKTGDILDF